MFLLSMLSTGAFLALVGGVVALIYGHIVEPIVIGNGGTDLEELPGSKRARFFGGFLMFLAVVLFIASQSFVYVDPTKRVLQINSTTGEIKAINGVGIQFRMPFMTDIIEYDGTIQVMTFKTTEGQAPDSPFRNIEVRDNDMMMIGLDIEVHWRIADFVEGGVDPVVTIYKDRKTMSNLQAIVANFIRSEIRSAFENMGINTEDLAAKKLTGDVEADSGDGTLGRMSTNFKEHLNRKLAEYGIYVEYVGVRQPDLDDNYEQSVLRANVAQQEQEVNAQENAANLEAEQGQTALALEQANRTKETTEIQTQTEVDRQLSLAQGDAQAILIRAEAEAEAISKKINAYGGFENYWREIQAGTLNDDVQIIFTDDGVIPILQFGNVDGSVTAIEIPDVEPTPIENLDPPVTETPQTENPQ